MFVFTLSFIGQIPWYPIGDVGVQSPCWNKIVAVDLI